MRSPRRARLAGRLLGFAGALLTACSAAFFLASPALAQECQWESNFNPQIRKPVGQGIAGSAWHNLIEFEGIVDFGDGETIPISVGTPFEHVFTEPGTYTVTSSGKGVGLDTAGNRVACEAQGFVFTTVTVYPLEARFTFEAQEGGEGAPSTFAYDGSASIPEGEIVQYFWDFGDGSTAEGATATHAFSSPGLFTVTLSILDASGNTASTTKTVGTDGFFPVDVGGYVGDNAQPAGPFRSGATSNGGPETVGGGTSYVLPTIVVIGLVAFIAVGYLYLHVRRVDIEEAAEALARKFRLKPEEALLILADLQTKGMFRGTGIEEKARAAVGLKPMIDVSQISTIRIVRDPKTGEVSYELTLNTGAGTKTCSVEG